jgi:hypothetical protein
VGVGEVSYKLDWPVKPMFKGTVQRKLTGVESGINRKAFLSPCTTGVLFFIFKGNLLFKSQKPVSTAIIQRILRGVNFRLK